MNMFIANVPGPDGEAFPAADQPKYPFEFSFDILILHDFATVPWDPNQVVLATVCAVIELIQSDVAQIKSPPFLEGDFIVTPRATP